MTTSWWIRGGRIVDPATQRDGIGDLVVENGHIHTDTTPAHNGFTVIDARGLVVVPGLIDLHVHFREPGNPDAETVATGSAAAAAGGFTTVVTMPNTTPPVDSPDEVRHTLERAHRAGRVRVLPSACITSARNGQRVAELEHLADAGAVAFTDDGSTVADSELLEAAMRRAAPLGCPILDHAQDPALVGDGVMHEGAVSARLGLPGIPPQAETQAVERDIRLAEATGCAMHIQHVSCAGTVERIAAAQARGIPVSGEATPHHIALIDEDIPPGDADFKMNPPLGGRADRTALIDGLCKGILVALATDHAPHTPASKQTGFLHAPFGIVGLETAVGITYSVLVASGRMPLSAWVARWTRGPCEVLGRPVPTLQPGAVADLALLDLETEWSVDPDRFVSKSRNSPFRGRRVRGRPVYTFREGRMTFGCRSRPPRIPC